MQPLLHTRRELLDHLAIHRPRREPHALQELLVERVREGLCAAKAQEEIEVLSRRELRVGVEFRRDDGEPRPVRRLA